MIVDQHQPVVEKYYGPGKMTSVLKRLLEECDKITKTLIEGWEEERSVKRKVCILFKIQSKYTHVCLVIRRLLNYIQHTCSCCRALT